MHFKMTTFFLVVILLTNGCVGSQEGNIDVQKTKEEILVGSENYTDLVLFYKNQLKKEETHYYKEKLAEVYFKLGDYDSAIFVFSTMEQSLRDSPSYLLEAKSLIEIGMEEEALEIALRIHNDGPDNQAEVENFLGVIYAVKKDLKKSRYYFNLSRRNFYYDLKVQNNLAVLDLIEGKYESANERLLTLYYRDPTDALIESNLLLSMAKSGNKTFIQKILSSKLSKDQIDQRYNTLRKAKLLVDLNELENKVKNEEITN